MAAENPNILSWNRLEPRPRTENFDRTLRVEVRDPLWMMTRQWQFGEFQAEDTGSALFSRLHMKASKINRVKLRNNSGRNKSSLLPLEADVEKEILEYDFLMRLEMGRYWEHLIGAKIRKESVATEAVTEILVSDVIERFRTEIGVENLQFTLPDINDSNNAHFYSNPSLWQSTAAVTEGRGIDGKKLYDWLKGGGDPMAFLSGLAVDSGHVTDVLNGFYDWFDRNYAQPDTVDESAWNSKHLEYEFAVAAPDPDSGTDILLAEEYYQGKLDWYAFDFDKDNTFPDLASAEGSEIINEKITVIPTTISFSGMPHPRWWQMEDQRVDLGDINPSTSDTAKIVYSEFGLIYSNDWMVFPHTVKAGTLCDLKEVVVTDCFGQRTKVVSANGGDDDDWNRWSFFGINTKGEGLQSADTRLYIPAVIGDMQESEPVESVNFIRDEMANMVWGIEQIIPNGLGGGIDGYETALKHVDFLKKTIVPPPFSFPIPNEAEIQYKVANTVPENWIPFIPARLDTSVLSRQIQLRRAAMPRYLHGEDIERIRPKSQLLLTNNNVGDNAYYLHEEEVPRSGTIVKRTWQRTRMEDGSVVTWLGRRKTNGKGEGSSNLAFDEIKDR